MDYPLTHVNTSGVTWSLQSRQREHSCIQSFSTILFSFLPTASLTPNAVNNPILYTAPLFNHPSNDPLSNTAKQCQRVTKN